MFNGVISIYRPKITKEIEGEVREIACKRAHRAGQRARVRGQRRR